MHRRERTTFTILFCTVLTLPASSLQAQDGASAGAADAFYQAQEWEAAAAAFEALAARQPENGQTWFRLGQSLHHMQAFERAAAAYLHADSLGFAPPFTRYNLACAYARSGKKDAAFTWLERAVEAGFGQLQLLKTDEDLASLRDDARFQDLLAEADRKTRPCAHEPVYRQFDFWAGTWEVFTPQGQKAGTNRIDKTLDGCLLLENWTGAGGMSGKSMNYYDAALQKWVQIWVNSRGGITRYEGTYSGGAMRFEGEQIEKDGTRLRYRMRFSPLPDGSVRQYIEESRDQGARWQEWFDGTYVKSEPAP